MSDVTAVWLADTAGWFDGISKQFVTCEMSVAPPKQVQLKERLWRQGSNRLEAQSVHTHVCWFMFAC